jgi:hypothetical protein
LMAGCIGVKPNGDLCQGVAARGSDWCPAHDPARKEARRKSASRAARSKKPGREIADVKDQVAELIREVRAGSVERSDAIACAQLYNVYLRAVGVEMKVREVEEIAREVEEFRVVLEAQKGGRRWG